MLVYFCNMLTAVCNLIPHTKMETYY